MSLQEVTRGRVGRLGSSCGDRDWEGKRHGPWLPWSPYAADVGGVGRVVGVVVGHSDPQPPFSTLVSRNIGY